MSQPLPDFRNDPAVAAAFDHFKKLAAAHKAAGALESPIRQDLKPGEGVSRPVKTEEIRDRVVPLIIPMQALCIMPLGFHARGALAIAHCQVEADDPLRFFVTSDGVAYVNPHIVAKRFPFFYSEGCMSFASRQGLRQVQRFHKIIVSYTRVDPFGNTEGVRSRELDNRRDRLAVIIQHEIDHFNGKHIFA